MVNRVPSWNQCRVWCVFFCVFFHVILCVCAIRSKLTGKKRKRKVLRMTHFPITSDKRRRYQNKVKNLSHWFVQFTCWMGIFTSLSFALHHNILKFLWHFYPQVGWHFRKLLFLLFDLLLSNLKNLSFIGNGSACINLNYTNTQNSTFNGIWTENMYEIGIQKSSVRPHRPLIPNSFPHLSFENVPLTIRCYNMHMNVKCILWWRCQRSELSTEISKPVHAMINITI